MLNILIIHHDTPPWYTQLFRINTDAVLPMGWGVEHSECKWWLKMLSGWCHPRLATHQCKHSWKLTQEVKSNFLQALFQGKSVVRPVLERGKTRWWEYFAFLSRTLLFDLELQTNGNFWDKISGIGYFAAALNLKSKLRCVCIFSGVKSSGELSI